MTTAYGPAISVIMPVFNGGSSEALPALGSATANVAATGISDGFAAQSQARASAQAGSHGLIRPLPTAGLPDSQGRPAPRDPGLASGGAAYWPSDTLPTSDCDCGCDCSGGSGGTGDPIQAAQGVYDHSIASKSAFSAAGIRYFDGMLKLPSTDLSSLGFGTRWGQTRNWTNGSAPSSFNGSGVVDSQRPYLIQKTAGSDSTIIVVSSGTNARYFDLVGSVYVAHFFVQDQLTHPAGEFVLTATIGARIHFYDCTVTQVNQRGQFKSYSDPKGNTMGVTSLTGDGKLAEAQRTDSTSGVTESYLYSYAAPDPNAGLLSNATLRRKPGPSGPWTTVRQVAYTYYDSSDVHGNAGDLRLAMIEDGSSTVLDTKYYRYYTGEAGGYVHGLKYVFNPQSYARLVAALGSNLATLSDAQENKRKTRKQKKKTKEDAARF